MQACDPDGDDGSENDDQADAASPTAIAAPRGPPSCYATSTSAASAASALIVDLGAAPTGTLHGRLASAPVPGRGVRHADADARPTDLGGWGQPVDTDSATDSPAPSSVAARPTPAHATCWSGSSELGRDDGCTEHNPYRGRLGEIAFEPP